MDIFLKEFVRTLRYDSLLTFVWYMILIKLTFWHQIEGGIINKEGVSILLKKHNLGVVNSWGG